jgi:hypothetical protein
MPSPLSLTVTPGIVVPNSGVRIGHTELNQIANPTVSLAASSAIGPDFLDLPAITAALADTVRGRNYLRRSNFFWEDWKQPDGLSCPAGVLTENALEWYARPTGGAVTVSRSEEAPNASSTWGAKLTGSAGTTAVQYVTWVPSAIGGGLRDGDKVFSVYVYNPSGTAFPATPIMLGCTTPNERGTATLVLSGSPTSCTGGAWTRLQLYFPGGSYELQNGFYLGFSVGAFGSAASLTVAQAQLEIATVASAFIRPVLPPDTFANIPVLTDAERVFGGMVVIRLGNGELRLLPAPGSLLSPPVIGYNAAAGIPEWIDPDGSITVLRYTGTDQIFTVPTGATEMEIHCWGAGASSNTGRPGGVGGYSRGRFPCTAGTQFSAMVGGAGLFLSNTSSYGFGGIGGPQGGGGGLSGVFTGTGSIGFGDATRAFLIAGGGGAVYYNYSSVGSTATAGGNGNEAASAGGQPDFRGIGSVGGATYTAGGGGLLGGNFLTAGASPGRAGTGYLHTTGAGRPISTAGEVSFQPRSVSVTVTNGQRLIVPGSTSTYYQNEAGQTDKPGLIVIVWNPA